MQKHPDEALALLLAHMEELCERAVRGRFAHSAFLTPREAKHTQLTVTVVDELPEGALFTLETRQCVVASERIDGVAAHVYKYSRSQINELFRAGKIFLNGRCCENTNTVLKEGDVVSVRGEGRFVYGGAVRTTTSGNLSVEIHVYV